MVSEPLTFKITDLKGVWANSLDDRDVNSIGNATVCRNFVRFKNTLESRPQVSGEFSFPSKSTIIAGYGVTPKGNQPVRSLIIQYNNNTSEGAAYNFSNGVFQRISIDGNTNFVDFGSESNPPFIFENDVDETIMMLCNTSSGARIMYEFTSDLSSGITKTITANNSAAAVPLTIAGGECATKVENGFVICSPRVNSTVPADINPKQLLVYYFADPITNIGKATYVQYQFDAICTSVGFTKDGFFLTTLTELWLGQKDDIYDLKFYLQQQTTNYGCWFSYALPSIDYMALMFNGTNLVLARFGELRNTPAGLPDWKSFYGGTGLININRSMVGDSYPDRDTIITSRVDTTASSLRKVSVMAMDYKCEFYGFHDMLNIPEPRNIYGFFMGYYGSFKKRAMYFGEGYQIGSNWYSGLWVEADALQVSDYINHEWVSTRINPFNDKEYPITVFSLTIDFRIDGYLAESFDIRLYTYKYDDTTNSYVESVQSLRDSGLISDNGLPIGAQMPISFPVAGGNSYKDFKFGITCTAKYMKICGITISAQAHSNDGGAT